MRRVPRQSLHSDFVHAVRASGQSLVMLAARANFASKTQLSSLLTGDQPVRVTALNIERLRALAIASAYTGPIFKVGSR
jgi:hypothetical protein